MNIFKQVAAGCLTALLLCAVGINAYAHDVPNTSVRGSVTVAMHYQNEAVPGGTMMLYRVGKVSVEDGNYSFTPTDAFADCGESFHDIQSSDLAQRLQDYAEKQNITGTMKNIGDDGVAVFSDLEVGLYLLVQPDAANGYNKAVPFLISIPNMEDGAYVYDVDAAPKISLKKVSPVPPVESIQPTDPMLPQTGQLNWPVPVLLTLGLLLFSCGWLLRFGKKRNRHEK